MTHREGYNYCRIPGCTNFGSLRGINKETGEREYRNLCKWHKKGAKPLPSTNIPKDIELKEAKKRKKFYPPKK